MKPRFAFWLLLAGVFSVSISGILIRYASPYTNGIALAFWRSVASICFLAPFAWRRVPSELANFGKKDLFLIALAGVLLGLHFTTWIVALYYTSVASSTVLVNITPIFLALFGFFLLKDKLAVGVIVAIVMSFVGSILLGMGDKGDHQFPNAMWGNALSLLGALAGTGYMLAGRVVRQKGLSWLGYVFPVYFTSMLTVGTIALISGVPLALPKEAIIYVVLIAIFPQIIGHGSFNYALKYYNAAFLGLLGLSEPIFASLIAFALFSELPTTLSLIGMIIILASVGLAMWTESKT
jgi:drug/metabolite transporter (DMT)-like permease